MKTLIAIPCMDTVPTEFASSLINLHKPPGTSYALRPNSLIHDSRNNLAALALQNNYDRVLWLDSDMRFPPDLLQRLAADMDELNADYVSALYFKRHPPCAPVLYKQITYDTTPDGILHSEAIPYHDYHRNSIFPCAGTGFGAVLTTTSLLRRVWESSGPPFHPLLQMGEDLSFCYRASQINTPLYCDSRISIGHVGLYTFTEQDYQPPV